MDDESPNSESRYEEFVSTFTRYEADLHRFIRSLVPNATDTYDVLQQSAIVLWRKFDQYDPSTNFMKWACVVARFEALAYRRKIARDRLVFRENIFEIMADEGAEELSTRDQEKEALEKCMARLSEKQRQFLTLAYTPGVRVKEMAEAAGSSSAAFYMRLKRLRHQLQTCIETKLSDT